MVKEDGGESNESPKGHYILDEHLAHLPEDVQEEVADRLRDVM